MYSAGVDSKELQRAFKEHGKRFPQALLRALNDTAFDVRGDWRDEMPRVFDRPTAFTLNAVLYNKAKIDNLVAEVFLRNDAAKGVPPSKYLEAQVEGGARRAKRSEVLLRNAGVLSGDEYWTPGPSVQLDSSGNVPGRTVRTILSDLQASYDTAQHSTAESRGKRARRSKIGKREVFFYSRGPSGNRGDGRPQHLKRGIYGRTRTVFGSALRLVMHIVRSAPQYTSRYDVYELTRRLFAQRFERNYRRHMDRLNPYFKE
jgi:hypothetical protein